MQTLLTTENLIVGPPEISSFGRPAVELVSVCCQNQPASTGGEKVTTRSLTSLQRQNKTMLGVIIIMIQRTRRVTPQEQRGA